MELLDNGVEGGVGYMGNSINIIYDEIIDFAKQYKTSKVVLFGSRARGTNQDKSDIDIAVYGWSSVI